MSAEAFRRDLDRKPAAMRDLASFLAEERPWSSVRAGQFCRVVLLGMGSSGFAADVAARRLRSRGIDAWHESPSVETGHPGGRGTLAVGISAGGETRETVAALGRYADSGSMTVAMTNVAGSAIAAVSDRVVELRAGKEEGGVACRTYQHTLAVLLELESQLRGNGGEDVARWLLLAAEASEDLLDRADSWVRQAAELMAEGPSSFWIAPAERLSSAQQSALMVREGPRFLADACEAGDWLHVDVYLSKTSAYRAVLYSGSRFDSAIMKWMVERRAGVLSVGAEIDGAAQSLRYPSDQIAEVALLSECLVAELISGSWWLEQVQATG